MRMYSVRGGNCLEGEIQIQGSKNSVLPIIAAAILNKGKTVLYNCPKLTDVLNMFEILKLIGCKVINEGGLVQIDSSEITTNQIPEQYVQKMRASVIFLGAMLGRLKSVDISYPGGCSIGGRPIDLHLKGIKQLCVDIHEENGKIKCQTSKIKGCNINLDFPSVGATENIMLAAVLAEGTTTIYNAAKEPELVELQNFINSMGGKISGAGTEEITIHGVESLHDTIYTIKGDRIVAGTYLAAAACTKSDLLLKNLDIEDIKAVCLKFEEMGCHIKAYPDGNLWIKSPKELKPIDLTRTQPFPGFPTDMQAQFMVCLALAKGTSVISETIFECRYKHVVELHKMGADIIVDGRIAIVKGGKPLHGSEVYAKDLRGGAALVIAGLAADGVTTINNPHHIMRGYEHIDRDLENVGADICYIEDDIIATPY